MGQGQGLDRRRGQLLPPSTRAVWLGHNADNLLGRDQELAQGWTGKSGGAHENEAHVPSLLPVLALLALPLRPTILAFDEIAPYRTHAIKKQQSVQMVYLMLKGTRQQAFTCHLDLFSRPVQPPQ
jgi:hypothetical protein